MKTYNFYGVRGWSFGLIKEIDKSIMFGLLWLCYGLWNWLVNYSRHHECLSLMVTNIYSSVGFKSDNGFYPQFLLKKNSHGSIDGIGIQIIMRYDEDQMQSPTETQWIFGTTRLRGKFLINVSHETTNVSYASTLYLTIQTTTQLGIITWALPNKKCWRMNTHWGTFPDEECPQEVYKIQ